MSLPMHGRRVILLLWNRLFRGLSAEDRLIAKYKYDTSFRDADHQEIIARAATKRTLQALGKEVAAVANKKAAKVAKAARLVAEAAKQEAAEKARKALECNA